MFKFSHYCCLFYIFVSFLAAQTQNTANLKDFCLENNLSENLCSQDDEAIFFAIYQKWLKGDLVLNQLDLIFLKESLETLNTKVIDKQEISLMLEASLGNVEVLKEKKLSKEKSNIVSQISLFSSKNKQAHFDNLSLKLSKQINHKTSFMANLFISEDKLNSNFALVNLALNNNSFKQVSLGRHFLNDDLINDAGGIRDGLNFLGQFYDKSFQIGYFDGVFASITSPFILGIPFTFYTRQPKDSQLGRTYHSGIYFKHKLGITSFSGQLAESAYRNQKRGLSNTLSSFNLGLDLNPKLKLNLSQKNTGFDYFSSYRTAGIISYQLTNFSNLDSIEKAISIRDRQYQQNFAGTNSFQISLEAQLNAKLSLKPIFAHLNDKANKLNNLNLSGFDLDTKINQNFSFNFSAFKLDYENAFNRDDTIFSSSLNYLF